MLFVLIVAVVRPGGGFGKQDVIYFSVSFSGAHAASVSKVLFALYFESFMLTPLCQVNT